MEGGGGRNYGGGMLRDRWGWVLGMGRDGRGVKHGGERMGNRRGGELSRGKEMGGTSSMCVG